VGAYKRVDTDFAPVIVTASTRRGAQGLDPASYFAIQDLRSGGCRTAREAVIVGGYSAVPIEVEEELLSIGFDSIYRVAGNNRFGTAAAVALSLGTAPIPNGVSGCTDGSAADGATRMHFYANSVVEFRPKATECRLLGRTAVLADGLIGADALAAGWWTSFWQVPVLLHDASNTLRADTYDALERLNVSNVIVLGGASRISEEIVDEVRLITGANVMRVAGRDRYETSIKMAEYFGGWWKTNTGADSASSLLCFAASSGAGSMSRGWADALAAGAWCGAASGAAANPSAPNRRLGPTAGPTPFDPVIPQRPGRDAAPLILLRVGAETMPLSVSEFLGRVFDPRYYWCSSKAATEGCTLPGFGVVFGGPQMVTESVVNAISTALGGQIPGVGNASNPSITGLYATQTHQEPVARVKGSGYTQLCFSRDGYKDARWLLVGIDADPNPVTVFDAMSAGWYLNDADSTARSPSLGAPGCLRASFLGGSRIWMRAIGIDGRASQLATVTSDSERWVTLTEAIEAVPAYQTSGYASDSDDLMGGSTDWSFRSYAPPALVYLGAKGAQVNDVGITLTVNRGKTATTPDTFSAQWDIELSEGTLSGEATGEAIFDGGIWFLRGRSTLVGGTATDLRISGGFSGDIKVNGSGNDDDSLKWRFDGYGLG